MTMRKFHLLCCSVLLATVAVAAEAPPRQVPPPSLDGARHAGDVPALVLAGGCYWGMQAVFEHVRGVKRVVAGFAGQRSSAEDQLIRVAHAGPAESIRVEFDPAAVSYGQLLQIYFSVAHDPTEVDRQGPDVGPQYRSVIYYTDEEQKRVADAYIAQLQSVGIFAGPIATQVEPLTGFHPVGESQQDYVLKHPDSAYVVGIDRPKLAALKSMFPAIYAEPPVTFSSASP
jgi:peptide-methionine (S)-S-oxide reductase